MRMTIDKTIEFFNGLECHTPQAKDARDVAVDTMRKYQKIEDIIANWKIYGDVDSYDCIADIYEVLESEDKE